MALLTLTHGLIGAFAGVLAEGALGLGPSFGFLLGAVVLALGLALLCGGRPTPVSRPGRDLSLEPIPQPLPGPALLPCALLVAIAVAVGTMAQVLLALLPRLHPFAPQGPFVAGPASVVLLCSALSAPVIGRVVGRWGRSRSLMVGIAALAGMLALGLCLPAALATPLLPLQGLSHSLVLTGLTATSLGSLPRRSSGLGAGLVLAGYGLTESLCLLRFGSQGSVAMPAVLAVLIGATAVGLAGCLLLERTLRREAQVGSGSGGGLRILRPASPPE